MVSLTPDHVNTLYYGDNLDILRKKVKAETIDLCYIDPPFNSKRNYNQIYNNIGDEDRAQAQAFTDTWRWDDLAIKGYPEIIGNADGRFQPQLVELIKGLHGVLKEGSLLAYLVSIALRVTEIQRVLKHDGNFVLHCDPTASHYLKLVLDSVFCPTGGHFVNEIVWCYSQGGKSKKWFARKHDVLFWYAKGADYFFDGDAVRLPLTPHKQDKSGKSYGGRMGVDEDGRAYVEKWGTGNKKLYRYYLDKGKIPEDWWIDINSIQSDANERLGYPTQKPEALINEKKGADAGIDARAYFLTGKDDNAKIIFQVKSGGVKRGDIATLRGDMSREKAALAILITLEEPSRPMLNEAKAAGQYKHETMGRTYDRISIVTIRDIVEDSKRLEIPMSLEVLAAAQRARTDEDEQSELPF